MIQSQLAALDSLSREELATLWQECFKVPAPKLSRSTFLRQAIAWHIQTQVLGGLSLVEKRQIQSGRTKPITQTATGSRLVRVWQGKTHQVTVLADGYLHEDKTWKSLSAIAKHITGTPWSGPVFFGLKKTSK
ncbi:MAG: hypothetical protein RLZZ601_239 [Pseudomonadota bacterium]|jgi:hypothetical protein